MNRLDLYDRFNMNCVNTEDCSKCKCCDDETGDLVLCALMFGYQQGRADKDKELSELPNQYSEKLWKNAYERGKTNAIEEFVDLYEKFCNSDIACAREDCIGKFCPRCFRDNFMEQVKEQNK